MNEPTNQPKHEGLTRRSLLGKLGVAVAAVATAPAARAVKATVKQVLVQTDAPKGYDHNDHKWQMAIDTNRCIGCGCCVEACKKENHIPEGPYYRTWVERYIVMKPAPGSAETRGGSIGGLP